jgi:Lysyl oxidase
MTVAVRSRLALAGAVFILCLAGVAAAAGTAGSSPDDPGQLPDLRTVVPLHLQIQNTQQRDILRFSNGIANTGDGPWALRPEHVGGVTNAIQEIRDVNGEVQSEHLASTFEFHPAHNHWHIGDIAQFDVRRGSPTGPVVSDASIKVTFCLIDWYTLEGNSPTSQKEFWDCANSYQGVSVGYVDQYHQSTEGQQLDLTNAPDANDYYLVSTSNYAGKFLEKSTANNTAWVKFRLYRGGNGNRKVEVTGNSPCATPGLCGVGAPNR